MTGGGIETSMWKVESLRKVVKWRIGEREWRRQTDLALKEGVTRRRFGVMAQFDNSGCAKEHDWSGSIATGGGKTPKQQEKKGGKLEKNEEGRREEENSIPPPLEHAQEAVNSFIKEAKTSLIERMKNFSLNKDKHILFRLTIS